MVKGLLLQSKGGENGTKNNVKESIALVFYIIIYRFFSIYYVDEEYFSMFSKPNRLALVCLSHHF